MLNSITFLIVIIVQSIMTFVLTKVLIDYLGSDTNGIYATANQFMAILYILEGGITIASSVSLYNAIAKKEDREIENILTYTKKSLIKTSYMVFFIGIPISIIYAFFIKTNMSLIEVILTLLLTVISVVFTIGFTTKYKIIFQSTNRDYVLNIIQIVCTILMQGLIILLLINGLGFIWIRFILTFSIIFEGILVYTSYKIFNNRFVFSGGDSTFKIDGTNDLMIQKITSAIYNSLPLLLVSSFLGTMVSSVFIVYRTIYGAVKSLVTAIILGFQSSLGQLIAEKGTEKIKKLFLNFEFIVVIFMGILLTTTSIMILPFIKLYTGGVQDINYINRVLAISLLFITYFELLHIPSGTVMNLSGKFKTSKKIQLMAFSILILTSILGVVFFKLNGIIFGILLTSFILCILEVGYTHIYLFNNSILKFIKIVIPNFIFLIMVIFLTNMINLEILNYWDFIVKGFVIVLLSTISHLLLNIIFNYSYLKIIIKKK